MSTTQLRAFHGDPAIKAKYLDRVRAHQLADQLIQKTTWDDKTQKGCAIGCTLHNYSHSAYENELGIPRVLARLEDGIFEGLSVPDSKQWPARFLEAIQVGADLSMVWPRFAHWLLADPDFGVIRHAKTDTSKKAISGVAALYYRWISGENPVRKEWATAADAAAADAYAYATYAADADAAAADADAAAAAADAYAYATAAAADAYAYAADAYAADADADAAYKDALRSARRAQAEKLLGLINEAPVLS